MELDTLPEIINIIHMNDMHDSNPTKTYQEWLEHLRLLRRQIQLKHINKQILNKLNKF